MRGRGVGALLLIAAIAVGCTGTPAPSRSSPHAPRGVPTPVVKPALVLTADLSDRPARWQLVTKISVGRTISTLGMLPQSKEEPVPVFPTAFAVARDGSLWFLDVVHKRLAHFSMEGQFLSEIRGVHFEAIRGLSADQHAMPRRVGGKEDRFRLGGERQHTPKLWQPTGGGSA